LVNKFHRFSTANVIDALAGYLGNLVLTEKGVLEHKLVAIEKQRRHIVKTLRCDEVPSGFWKRAGIQQIADLPLFIVKSSQVNTLPKAKSKTRSKQNKDMHKSSSVHSD
jgi:hypothetical protein